MESNVISIIFIPINRIIWRKPLDPTRGCTSSEIYIARLIENIKQNGLNDPIPVFLKDKDGHETMEYSEECQVFGLDGHHRCLAYQKMGYIDIPCVIMPEPRKKPKKL
jgi:hypothetical protein